MCCILFLQDHFAFSASGNHAVSSERRQTHCRPFRRTGRAPIDRAARRWLYSCRSLGLASQQYLAIAALVASPMAVYEGVQRPGLQPPPAGARKWVKSHMR
jgi:hypothetical protein